MYITYAEYINKYEAIDEAEFNTLAERAKTEIDYRTFNRIEESTNEVKNCMAELINHMSQEDEREILSEKVGTYSVTYAGAGKSTEIKNIIKKHLLHTGLMYRGVGYDHKYPYYNL